MENPTRHTLGTIVGSICNKHVLTFCFFLMLSVLFWFITKLNGVYQQEFAIGLELENVPPEVVITTDPPKTIRVTITDKGWALQSYRYGDKLQPLKIDFAETRQSNGTGTIATNDLVQQLRRQLGSDAQISAIRPQQVTFYYNYGEKKRVPVEVVGSVATGNQYYLLDLTAIPDSVTVYARNHVLDTLKVARTQPLYLHDVADTLTVTADLESIAGIKFEPAHIRVHVKTDRMVEKTLQVPVKQSNFPAEKALRTFPSKVTVTCQVGMHQYKELSPDDFPLVITYDDLLQNKGTRIRPTLKSQPKGVTKVKISPEELEYVIEDIANGKH